MVKDETSVKSTGIKPIYNEFFDTLRVLQILRYLMGMTFGIPSMHTSNLK